MSVALATTRGGAAGNICWGAEFIKSCVDSRCSGIRVKDEEEEEGHCMSIQPSEKHAVKPVSALVLAITGLRMHLNGEKNG